jgi:uncharacterized protein YjeT (DUF2065 family)
VTDLWAALCLVLLLEGLFLFAAPAAWKRMATQVLAVPDRRLSAIGGGMVIAGLVFLYLLRGG